MSEGWDFPHTARAMAKYFTGREEMQGSRWAAGRIAAKEWLRLIENGVQSDEDLAHLDALISAGAGDDGSAWVELRLGYNAWRAQIS